MDKVAAAASVRGQMVVVCYNYGLLTTNQLQYCLCTKTPQDLSGDNYMFTFYFRSNSKGSRLRRAQWLMGALLKRSRPHVRYRDYVLYTEMFSLLCTVHSDTT